MPGNHVILTWTQAYPSSSRGLASFFVEARQAGRKKSRWTGARGHHDSTCAARLTPPSKQDPRSRWRRSEKHIHMPRQRRACDRARERARRRPSRPRSSNQLGDLCFCTFVSARYSFRIRREVELWACDAHSVLEMLKHKNTQNPLSGEGERLKFWRRPVTVLTP